MGTFDTNVPNLEDYDRALQVRVQRATEVTVERVLRELEAVAFFDPGPLLVPVSSVPTFDWVPIGSMEASPRCELPL